MRWGRWLRAARDRDAVKNHGGTGAGERAPRRSRTRAHELQENRDHVQSWLRDVEALACKAGDVPHPELKALAAALHAHAGSLRRQLQLDPPPRFETTSPMRSSHVRDGGTHRPDEQTGEAADR